MELHTASKKQLTPSPQSVISAEEYENLVADTLVSLAECFEDLPEKINCSKDYDVTYHDGVLTISLGGSLGTYVINKQSPNRQIWLSSPKSGPKRYDYEDGRWIYHRGREGLHSLLEKELSEILQTPINLSSCFCYS
ncbi:hypothetical protein C0Q70_20580 [Pomacea canaliculata]|uniref:ferroxidase n=1 Tax=Pomacea canaliculata TaxID=400727 RepID=A0A2T7NFZ9_POMCA|nr:hypothetical protein C0Q70_20580 [Pomacea canaliculata]